MAPALLWTQALMSRKQKGAAGAAQDSGRKTPVRVGLRRVPVPIRIPTASDDDAAEPNPPAPDLLPQSITVTVKFQHPKPDDISLSDVRKFPLRRERVGSTIAHFVNRVIVEGCGGKPGLDGAALIAANIADIKPFDRKRVQSQKVCWWGAQILLWQDHYFGCVLHVPSDTVHIIDSNCIYLTEVHKAVATKLFGCTKLMLESSTQQRDSFSCFPMAATGLCRLIAGQPLSYSEDDAWTEVSRLVIQSMNSTQSRRVSMCICYLAGIFLPPADGFDSTVWGGFCNLMWTAEFHRITSAPEVARALLGKRAMRTENRALGTVRRGLGRAWPALGKAQRGVGTEAWAGRILKCELKTAK
eukprot:m.95387 g.95387  ORF g.95387 m.95387 type:complete len:357 (-) comp18426_c0_seq6:242-1312(-)